MLNKCIVTIWNRQILNTVGQFRLIFQISVITLRGRPLQGLTNDVFRRHWTAKQHRGNFSNFFALLFQASNTCQGCRCADTLQASRMQSFSCAPNQQ